MSLELLSDSMWWIFKFITSATSCIMIWLAHVSCLDILDKYLSHDAPTLLSLNRSEFFIKYRTPASLICKWWLGSRYNWCDIDLKKQSPPPPTSRGLNLHLSILYNLDYKIRDFKTYVLCSRYIIKYSRTWVQHLQTAKYFFPRNITCYCWFSSSLKIVTVEAIWSLNICHVPIFIISSNTV